MTADSKPFAVVTGAPRGIGFERARQTGPGSGGSGEAARSGGAGGAGPSGGAGGAGQGGAHQG
ncbi:hypothetical protein [Georgenia ruanii]|uniref:hypothetical protein n=1 Tax=Georgenia ruanii TaxID=348442 RepID=UPI0012650BCE|nr:hypothetical protein [Georgenia ruanii]